MSSEIPGKVPEPDKLDPNKSIKGPGDQGTDQSKFEQFMKEPAPGQAAQGTSQTNTPTPAELAKQAPLQTGQPTMQSILGQMNATSSSLGDLQKMLHTKNLKLKSSQKYLLRNKLQDASDLIRTATQKSGAQTGPAPTMSSRQNPIARFLELLTDGQRNISLAESHIKKLAAAGHSLTPGQLLLVQVKIAKAQQEIEYSSIVLANAVSDVKMLFNVQI